MADILHLVPIEASPEEIYDALTKGEGLRAWWTTDVDAEPAVGSPAEFRFEGGQVVMHMRVERLEPGEAVSWSVQDPAPPEWDGTEITWNIVPGEGATNLLFGHRGWKATDGSFPAINYNWAYYLTSLKDYLEKGGGFPHDS